MEFINPTQRIEKSREDKAIKEILIEKGLISKEELKSKKKSLKGKN